MHSPLQPWDQYKANFIEVCLFFANLSETLQLCTEGKKVGQTLPMYTAHFGGNVQKREQQCHTANFSVFS